MLDSRYSKPEEACGAFCTCTVCNNKNINTKLNPQQKSKPQLTVNCLHTFLQLLPKYFNISIISTACPKPKLFYFNKSPNYLMIIPLYKIIENFQLAINIVLFYSNKSMIINKYQLSKAQNTYNYIQAYNSFIPYIVSYHREDNFMDQLLSEKLQTIVQGMLKNNKNQRADKLQSISAQKDFLTWVHKQYQDNIFCKYMIKIYCRYIQKTKSISIISGQFEWQIQKIGIKLCNIKYLQMQKIQKTATFQQQYQQKILQKLHSNSIITNSLQLKLFNTFVGKSRINFRINKFKNQIRDIFQKEKNKILENTEQERTLESKSLSDDVAKLFLPQLQNYSSLRQVLNDQKKFKLVVLGIDEDEKVNKTINSKLKLNPLNKLRDARSSQMSSLSKNKNIITRHYRSKTQV